jgi:GGDEF domain-containing protein
LVDTALRADTLTALVAAVYASHDGLTERALAFERAAREAGDERNALLGRLVRADIDNRNGRWAEGLQTAYALLHEVRPEDDSRSVLARADHHLYEAKNAGRNRVIAD